jgi:hypothetical protein
MLTWRLPWLQCRRRWVNHLTVDTRKGGWTEAVSPSEIHVASARQLSARFKQSATQASSKQRHHASP